MVAPNRSTPSPFVVAIAFCLVFAFTPALLSDSLVPALTATPFRRAVSGVVLSTLFAGVLFWTVANLATAHGAAVSEGSES